MIKIEKQTVPGTFYTPIELQEADNRIAKTLEQHFLTEGQVDNNTAWALNIIEREIEELETNNIFRIYPINS